LRHKDLRNLRLPRPAFRTPGGGLPNTAGRRCRQAGSGGRGSAGEKAGQGHLAVKPGPVPV